MSELFKYCLRRLSMAILYDKSKLLRELVLLYRHCLCLLVRQR